MVELLQSKFHFRFGVQVDFLGAPGMHGMSRFVRKRSHVIKRTRIVQKNIGLGGRTAGAERAASLAAAEISGRGRR